MSRVFLFINIALASMDNVFLCIQYHSSHVPEADVGGKYSRSSCPSTDASDFSLTSLPKCHVMS